MNNPWKEIPYSDYENHMREVGQTQVLSNLTKYSLDKYLPENFALLGCATGNGLENVKSEITKRVYAIDINQVYLEKTKENFADKITQLETIKIDIQNDVLKLKSIDLFFVGLVLEYVEPKKVLEKIISTLSEKGVLVIVIQKNSQTSFVSKTKYKSLEKLADFHCEVNESEIDKYICSENMQLIKREELRLTENKSLIVLEYKSNVGKTNA
jgi:ubiquinone/menaquinone biosynthesis C-methylase UbiE